MNNKSVNTADVKAEGFTIPFNFFDLASGNQFCLDYRNNAIVFRDEVKDKDLDEALDVLKKEGYSEDIALDHLVDYSIGKYLIVSKDLHFSVKTEMLHKVIRPNKATLHYDLLVVKTNEGLGDIPAFIGYPISSKTSMFDYEIILQYEEGGPRWFIYPTMVYYIPDDEGYKVVSEEKVPNEILRELRERELDYIRDSETDIPDFNKAGSRFKELFFKTVKRHNRLLK